MLKELDREVYTQANGPSAWDNLTEQGMVIEKQSKPSTRYAPKAPWSPGPGRNARIKGWDADFVGLNKCPFPPNLLREYNLGQAYEQNTKGFVKDMKR